MTSTSVFTRKQLSIIFKIAFLEAMALSLIIPTISSTGEISASHDITSLGTWKNMPNSSSCGVGNTSAQVCELMGNQSYRGLFESGNANGLAGIRAGLSISCIKPSNTIGAFLQLQYANYSFFTLTNTSNFINVGASSSLKIDNSANNPCPGNIISSGNNILPTLASNPALYIFRVVGVGGGGLGDNPRFSSVIVNINQVANVIFVPVVSARTLTTFTAFEYAIPFQPGIDRIVTFNWVATNNGVAIESGTNVCTILAGTNSCSITTTFPVAFVTTIPNVVLTTQASSMNFLLSIADIPLLMAQTITV